MFSVLRGAMSVGEMVIEALLHTRQGNQLVQWICGRTNGGHSYRVGLVASEGEDVFVMDPLAECKHCLAPLSEESYAGVVSQYLRLRADDEHVED